MLALLLADVLPSDPTDGAAGVGGAAAGVLPFWASRLEALKPASCTTDAAAAAPGMASAAVEGSSSATAASAAPMAPAC